MDQEVYRLVMALLLTGLVLFAWQYYRGILLERTSEHVEVRQQVEKGEPMAGALADTIVLCSLQDSP